MALGICNHPKKCFSQICVLQMGLAANILGRTSLQSCCRWCPPLTGARARGQSFRCPYHSVLGVQDPQEEVRARCVHTLPLGSAPTPTCCPGHRKSLLGAAGRTRLSETWEPEVLPAGDLAGHHGKPLLYRVQMQHVTCRCKNLLASTPAVHLPRKRSGQACPESASIYRAGKLHLFRETLPIK